MSIEFVSYMTKIYREQNFYNSIDIALYYNKLRNKPDDYKIDEYISKLCHVDIYYYKVHMKRRKK